MAFNTGFSRFCQRLVRRNVLWVVVAFLLLVWLNNSSLLAHRNEKRAAFADDADIVEFDVRPTRDGKLAVFHDDTLEYRTDKKGPVRDHVMDESQIANISAYGNDPARGLLREDYPEMKLLSMKTLKRALLSYELIGWTGIGQHSGDTCPVRGWMVGRF